MSIRQVFLNVNMGNRFDGLCNIAKKSGVNVLKLETTDYLIFVNTARDKIAMLVGEQTIAKRQAMAYVRLPSGRKLDMLAIREIPCAFDGTAIDYDKALGAAIDAALAKRGERVIKTVK